MQPSNSQTNYPSHHLNNPPNLLPPTEIKETSLIYGFFPVMLGHVNYVNVPESYLQKAQGQGIYQKSESQFFDQGQTDGLVFLHYLYFHVSPSIIIMQNVPGGCFSVFSIITVCSLFTYYIMQRFSGNIFATRQVS